KAAFLTWNPGVQLEANLVFAPRSREEEVRNPGSGRNVELVLRQLEFPSVDMVVETRPAGGGGELQRQIEPELLCERGPVRVRPDGRGQAAEHGALGDEAGVFGAAVAPLHQSDEEDHVAGRADGLRLAVATPAGPFPDEARGLVQGRFDGRQERLEVDG